MPSAQPFRNDALPRWRRYNASIRAHGLQDYDRGDGLTGHHSYRLAARVLNVDPFAVLMNAPNADFRQRPLGVDTGNPISRFNFLVPWGSRRPRTRRWRWCSKLCK